MSKQTDGKRRAIAGEISICHVYQREMTKTAPTAAARDKRQRSELEARAPRSECRSSSRPSTPRRATRWNVENREKKKLEISKAHWQIGIQFKTSAPTRPPDDIIHESHTIYAPTTETEKHWRARVRSRHTRKRNMQKTSRRRGTRNTLAIFIHKRRVCKPETTCNTRRDSAHRNQIHPARM